MTIHAHIQGTTAADAPTELLATRGISFPTSDFPEPVEGFSSSPSGVSQAAGKEKREGFDQLSQVGVGDEAQTEATTHFRAALSALDAAQADTTHGWTPQRQSRFLAAIADGAAVQDAAKDVGLSRRSAYALRRRVNGHAFNLGWQAAEILARDSLRDELWDRAHNGQSWTTVRDDGEKIITTTRHRHDNRLALAMLTRLDARVADQPFTAPVRVAGKFDDFLTLLENDAVPADRAVLVAQLREGIGTCEPCEPLADSAAPPAGPPVWFDVDADEWLTRFPPPGDYDGEEEGYYGMPGYCRTLSDDEEDAVAHLTPEIVPTPEDEALTQAHIARATWFVAALTATSVAEVEDLLIPLPMGGGDQVVRPPDGLKLPGATSPDSPPAGERGVAPSTENNPLPLAGGDDSPVGERGEGFSAKT